jgi:replicative DNA helicase
MTTVAELPPAPDDLDPEPWARAQPHDLGAEQALLGRIALAPDARRLLRDLQLNPTAYYRLAHELIHQALAELANSSEPIDPLTLTAALQRRGDLQRVGGVVYLHTLFDAGRYAASTEWLAHRINDLAQRRDLIRTGQQITQAAWALDTEDDASELAEHAVAELRRVRDAGRAAEDAPVKDVVDFVDETDPGHDWVIPGLLEHTDRVIWTAGEGGGKSVLQRQIAVTAACGVFPFARQSQRNEPLSTGPQRVLVLDCENSDRQSRRHYRSLLDIAKNQGTPVRRGQLHIDLRPEGVDLTRAEGRAWLMRRVESVMPDLLIVGPIYRLHAGDPNSEELARKISVVLDEARATAGCALTLEAHSPQGTGLGPRALRPVGSSLWLRWPEFGMGLRPVEDERSARDDRARRVLPWRGGRDERAWPSFICQGWSGNWPWRSYTPVDADRFSGHSPTGALS